ncbi:MAG: sugar transferase [Syntrophobacteraceae bacterium]
MSLKMSFREKSSFLVKILHAWDCITVVLLLFLMVWAYAVPWSTHYSYLVTASFALCFATFYSFQLYRPWRSNGIYREFLVILKAWGVVVGAILSAFFVFKVSDYYSRVSVLAWFVATPLVVFATHLSTRYFLRSLRSKGEDLKNAVIVGAGDLGREVVQCIEKTPWLGIHILGFFDDREQGPIMHGMPVLGKIDELPVYLKKNQVDFVYLALPMRAEGKIMFILDHCRTLGAEIYLVPDLYLFRFLNAEIQTLGDILLVNFNPSSRAKRIFDIVFSLLVLLATLPITLFIALIIKVEDRGPIFYGHARIMNAGKTFRCLKFRTMHVNADKKLAEILNSDPEAKAEWQKSFKLKNDPRITRIGKFLRKTSLDELPQFINVLKGEMSVVGARPIVYTELSDYYRECSGLYCSMKPGITGPWQVGKRSDTEDYEERVRLDTWYVLNYSLWLDVKIIAKTVSCMISGKGAY